MDEQTKREFRQYVERWRLAAPALEDQHISELVRLDDETAWVTTLDLFTLWRPLEQDDFGAELVEQRRVFRSWHRLQRSDP